MFPEVEKARTYHFFSLTSCKESNADQFLALFRETSIREMNLLILLVALVILIYAAFCATYKKWFPRFAAYDPASHSIGWAVEGFQDKETPAAPVPHEEHIGVNANDKADANLENNQPYHLLQDERANARPQLSNVSTAGCYATDMEQHLSKVGNYRQLTNNYRRAGPDSCSAPWKELLFHFYKMTPFHA